MVDSKTGPQDDEARRAEQRAEHINAMCELLHNSGELGPALFTAYDTAVQHYPELAEVTIRYRSTPQADATMGARSVYILNNEVPLRGIALDPTPTVEVMRERMRGQTSGLYLTDFMSKKLGVASERISPEMFAQFVLLHELGHAKNTFDGETPHEWRERRNQEMARLPIPGRTPGQLEAEIYDIDSDLDRWYQGEQAELTRRGWTTRSDIVDAQRETYRELPTEAFADRFALSFFARNLSGETKLARIALFDYE